MSDKIATYVETNRHNVMPFHYNTQKYPRESQQIHNETNTLCSALSKMQCRVLGTYVVTKSSYSLSYVRLSVHLPICISASTTDESL